MIGYQERPHLLAEFERKLWKAIWEASQKTSFNFAEDLIAVLEDMVPLLDGAGRRDLEWFRGELNFLSQTASLIFIRTP